VKKILFWPYQVYAWLIFFPLTAIWCLFCGWLAVLAAIAVSPKFASRYVGIPWARLIGLLTPMRVTVEGAENADPRHSYVVVCNHVSQYDILLVYGWLSLDLKWVMKKEIRKLPGIGIACEKVGHIFVDRGKPEAAKQAINEALERVGDGVGVLFFPEGTRSVDARLKRFKTGAFRTALDTGLPVLPVTLLGTQKILPAKSLRLFPGRAGMVIHPPIEAGEQTVRELRDATHEVIASALPEAQRPL
jgi:1-acyl-sn-glycerol-3-phosphate acyltransferase